MSSTEESDTDKNWDLVVREKADQFFLHLTAGQLQNLAGVLPPEQFQRLLNLLHACVDRTRVQQDLFATLATRTQVTPS